MTMLCTCAAVQAANFTTAVQQGSTTPSQNWYTNGSGVGIWQPGNTQPTAGNTYECVAGGNPTRIRNPAFGASIQTFPGDSFQLNTNTEIRAKTSTSPTTLNFPGVGGAPGLILNGGNLDTGDNGVFNINGVLVVQNPSSFTCGDTGGNNTRGWKITGQIRGNANVVVWKNFGGGVNAMELIGTNNSFSGTWIMKSGGLKATGPQSLGTNASVVLFPTNAALNATPFEPMYDVSSAGSLVISNGGTMVLHQNCTWASVRINNTALSLGAHPYAELTNSFPGVFATNGSGSITVQPPAPPTAPTNVTAVSEDTKVTLSWTVVGSATSYVVNRADTSGGPYATVGTTTAPTFADTAVVNGLTYYYVIVATNSLGASPNSAEVIGQPNPVVTGIVAVGGTNQVTLSWDTLVTASSYSVLRSTASNGTYTVVGSGIVGTSYLDTTPLSGRTYWYRVSAALTGGGQSGQSAAVPATTAPGAPVASTSLFASTVIRVAWTSDPVVTGFSIEQSTDGVNFSPLATVGATARSYTNSGLTASTTYFYRIQAMNATGPSDYSAVVSNATPAIGYNVNFQLGTSPIPPGYLKDIGDLFGDRTNGFSYGWATLGGTNITVDARQRNNASSPDLRYDTFIHLMKGLTTTNPALSATWEMEIPNGFYSIHIVAGDPDNGDPATDRFQFNVEGALTSAYSPALTPFINRFGEFNIGVGVSDGRLTIGSGPLALNNKIAFVDIYPAVPTAPTITVQPQDTTIEQNRPVSLISVASGSAVLAYQWYFTDGVTSTPVVNGTNSTLTFARPQPSDSGDYYLIATNYGGSATSDVATLTVDPDVVPPTIVSVGSLDGINVGICFSEEIDITSGAALEASNYQINGGNVVVTSFSFRPDGKAVKLTLATPISGAYTVDVLDVPDYAGNSTVSSTNAEVLGFIAQDVGSPNFAGLHYTCDGETFEVVGGGADVWGTGDQAYLATKSISGDFDARIRVTGLRGSNTITKAVLVVRESTQSGSAAFHISVNPPAPARNQIEMGYRPAFSNATVAVGASFIPAGVPNAWMRIVRVGTTFIGYRSTNGTDWILLGQTNAAFAADLQLGFGVTAHDNTLLATGTFSGFTVSQAFPQLAVTKTASPEPVTRNQNVTYTISVTNSGSLPAGGSILTDVLPAGLTFVSAVSSQGSCANAGSTVTCDLGTIAANGQATVTVVATVTSYRSITNRATITTTSLENSINNTGTAITTVTPPTPSPILDQSYSSSNGFSAAIQTESGITYALQSRSNLNAGTLWQTLTTFSGDGTVKVFTDPVTNAPMRFYQIIIP
jgi:uncharacterized repeat protein (TIGR01451 family)